MSRARAYQSPGMEKVPLGARRTDAITLQAARDDGLRSARARLTGHPQLLEGFDWTVSTHRAG
ncbi:hypothetical protein EV650_6348 [Kribbella kalugense]|uniref:Uncharacterized protein n=1 Tax=Kribbella kalugense TaxID=2512221 RepID=A0A4R7ZIH4_9ACTN|nr:hypothetical protein EV650_6348 [Kribbella kalugense]